MLSDELHITLQGFVRNRLNFDTLEEWVIYQTIHNFSQSNAGVYFGTIGMLADIAMVSVDTVQRNLQRLISKGYIKSEPREGKTTLYFAREIPTAKCGGYPPQNAGGPSAKCGGINNIYINKIKASNNAHTRDACDAASSDFNLYFSLFNPTVDMLNREAACKAEWNNISQIKRDAIIEYLQQDGERKTNNPLFFLRDFPEPTPDFPKGARLGEMLAGRDDMVQVIYNNRYQITTADEAKKFNLQITKKMTRE